MNSTSKPVTLRVHLVNNLHFETLNQKHDDVSVLYALPTLKCIMYRYKSLCIAYLALSGPQRKRFRHPLLHIIGYHTCTDVQNQSYKQFAGSAEP